MTTPLRVATRGSRLALRQVELVAEMLGVRTVPVIVSTVGDRRRDVPLRTIAGKGAFTGEVRDALAAGAADIAVHSAKDLPATDDRRFTTVYPVREDARDALVGSTLAELPHGGVVATGAPRRRAQLSALRCDLRFSELRGNIDTRLAKAPQFDAIVVAAAALRRLRITVDAATELLPVDDFVPQVGQGVLAVDARADDRRARSLIGAIDNAVTRLAITAERTFLEVLGGDCDLPAGAHATVLEDGAVHLQAVLATSDGRLLSRRSTGCDPLALATATANELLSQVARLAKARTVA